jgi:hypothetical protein
MNKKYTAWITAILVATLLFVGCSDNTSDLSQEQATAKKLGVDAALRLTIQEVHRNLTKSTHELHAIKEDLEELEDSDSDLRTLYKSFKRAAAEMEYVTEGLKLNRTSINLACGAVLTHWEEGLPLIADEDLREQSADRLEDAVKEQQKLDELLAEGNEVITVYMTTLQDIATYLDLELSEDSIKDASDSFKRALKSGEEIHKWVEDLLEELEQIKENFSV